MRMPSQLCKWGRMRCGYSWTCEWRTLRDVPGRYSLQLRMRSLARHAGQVRCLSPMGTTPPRAPRMAHLFCFGIVWYRLQRRGAQASWFIYSTGRRIINGWFIYRAGWITVPRPGKSLTVELTISSKSQLVWQCHNNAYPCLEDDAGVISLPYFV
jgi:hypothetical protein